MCGSDDFQMRVYNYNTSEKITSFEAHPDYIRAIAVHPTQPFVLTASDDMTIKLWDWEKGWKCVQVFEGHGHYVMGLAINPKDTNTFASASLDRTVKIWSLGSATPNFTLEAHETKGVNHVDYYPHSDKPYLLTTSDDRTVKIWDYTTKSLIATLEGHTNNVSFACYHPELPVIISGSEDGTIRIWHANTYRFEQSLNYNLERAWCVSYQKGKQGIAVGFDDGAVVVKLGREEPAVSMDASGKLIWARHNEVVSSIIKGGDASLKDNEPISLPTKDLGTCEVYPQTLIHSPNGRFVAVCGDGEYIIYTALAWRNKAFGSALDFVWASKDNSNDFAIRESAMSVKVYKNFVEKSGGLDVGFQAEGLTGGVLLGVTGQGGVSFFDWATGGLVRRIEVEPKQVRDYRCAAVRCTLTICRSTGRTAVSSLLLPARTPFTCCAFLGRTMSRRCSRGRSRRMVSRQPLRSLPTSARGKLSQFVRCAGLTACSVRTGEWVGDCFIYTNSTNRLNYLVGDQTYTVSHFDKPMYILGYIQRDSRIYLADKDVNVTSFSLSLPVLEYQTLVLREDMETAAELLPTIPADQLNKIARFLEGQGHKELALEVATDPEHKFELAIALNQLDIALEQARAADADHKWKTVGDAALAGWDVVLAAECFTHAKDLGSLLLLHSSTGNRQGLADLATQAEEAGAHNVAFTSAWLTGDIERCTEMLTKTGRIAEAVLFSQTYKPSLTGPVVQQWKESLEKSKRGRVAKLIGVPGDDEELFPEWDEWLRLEKEGGSAPGAGTNGKAADEPMMDVEDEDEDEGEGEGESEEE